jgi:hypothetical protein
MKIIIREACTVPGDEEGRTRHADVNETADVPKEDAVLLCRMGRAYFADKSDDPTKGTLTATSEDKDSLKKQAAALVRERSAREDQAAAQTPVGMATLVAVEVAKAIAAAQSVKA